MRRGCLSVLLLAACLPAFTQEVYYRSDQAGMLLAPISPALRDDSRWVLRVTHSGTDEDRRLYDNGKEVRRWQITVSADRRVERESANGVLTSRRLFDSAGVLAQEEQYTAGTLARTTFFSYVAGRLVTRRELDARGAEVSRDSYLYADNGRLREARHTVWGGSPSVSSVVAAKSGIVEERTSVDGTTLVERFDVNGRLVRREKSAPDGSTVREDFRYDAESGVLASSEERRSADGAVVDRTYDSAGRIAQETVTLKGAVSETSRYEHDSDGRVTSRTRRSAAGIEVWRTAYRASGDVDREEYWQRGVLVKVTVHGEGRNRTEELYRDGDLFLKVYYDGDTKLKEEVYDAGTLVRQRSFP
ncbi:MAG TPA: hypothetical protein VFI08_05665 [Spirochaetia bacterium]|nr:hypothetical protein [Spirochaetia bacterium]